MKKKKKWGKKKNIEMLNKRNSTTPRIGVGEREERI
jgi:hypothetical protein